MSIRKVLDFLKINSMFIKGIDEYSPEWDKFQKNIKVGDKVIYKDVKSTIIKVDRYKDFESSLSSVTVEMDVSKETMQIPINILVEYIARQELKYETNE